MIKCWGFFVVIFFFFFGYATWHVGSQFPNQGQNPRPLAVAGEGLNHWTTMMKY